MSGAAIVYAADPRFSAVHNMGALLATIGAAFTRGGLAPVTTSIVVRRTQLRAVSPACHVVVIGHSQRGRGLVLADASELSAPDVHGWLRALGAGAVWWFSCWGEDTGLRELAAAGVLRESVVCPGPLLVVDLPRVVERTLARWSAAAAAGGA